MPIKQCWPRRCHFGPVASLTAYACQLTACFAFAAAILSNSCIRSTPNKQQSHCAAVLSCCAGRLLQAELQGVHGHWHWLEHCHNRHYLHRPSVSDLQLPPETAHAHTCVCRCFYVCHALCDCLHVLACRQCRSPGTDLSRHPAHNA